MSYYAALSLDALGRKAEAAGLLGEMRTFAEGQIQEHINIDYFATSLPNLLLFDYDLQKRNRIDCLFLLALSELGMRDHDHATELLNEVLILDCNHLSAQEELRALTGMPMIAVRQ